MILQSLVRYYEALAARGEIPRPGWAKVKVSYALEIGRDGELLDILPLKDTSAKIPTARLMIVPERGRNSVDITPCFLCDDKRYILGIPEINDTKQKSKAEKAFNATKERYKEVLSDVDCKEAKAILTFFDNWEVQKAKWDSNLADISAKDNLVFFIGESYAQDIYEIQEAWDTYHWKSLQTYKKRCMISGEIDDICRIHPGFNLPGGTNPKLVSFDKDSSAFSSYGKDGQQGFNVQIGNKTASKYKLALEQLLREERSQCRIGNTRVVFWADDAEPIYQDIFSSLLGADTSTISNDDLYSVISAIVQGRSVNFDNIQLKPDNFFFVLGLTAANGRVIVRFFLCDSFERIIQNAEKHFSRLEIISNGKNLSALPLWKLLYATIRVENDKSISRNLEKVLPQMAGDTLRAIPTGGRYPTTLYQQTQLRIRAERDVTSEKAAIIKAYLLRNTDNEQYKEALTVELNEQSDYQPYILGRIFSLLEDIQRKANNGTKTTIKDKYFSSACATPAVVFPTLVNLAQKHLRKLDKGAEVFYSKQLGQLMTQLTDSYPSHLTLYDQGIFQIGYYHQTQKR